MPTVLLQGRIAADREALFRDLADPDWRIEVWDPRRDALDRFAPAAERALAIVGGNIPLPSWPPTPKLRLFQIPWTGYNFTSPERMPAGVPVCNCFGHEIPMAEYVMLTILEWQIGLRGMDARWRAEGWGGRLPAAGVFHREAYGATLGIVGYGHIGAEVAKRAKAFGMRVLALRRQSGPKPPDVDWMGRDDELDTLLEQSDFVLLACPLNERTQRMINADTLAKMGEHAVVINVARGEVIDEDALFEALKKRTIGGAVLDVWYRYNEPDQPEVWPSNRPFQELDNVILSAHESALTDGQVERRWRFVVENIRRVDAGEPPHNIVFEGTAGLKMA